jgi:uroporphyrinogen decarboxylase
MTNYERIHAAMSHKKADRVPVMCQLSQEFMARNSGVRPFDMYFSAPGYAQAFINLRKAFNFDGILLNTTVSDNWKDFYDNTKIETVGGIERYTLPNGAIFEQQGRNFVHINRSAPNPSPEIDDIDPDKLETKVDYTKSMALHKLIVEEGRKEHFSIHGEIGSPFDHLVIPLSVTNAMLALLIDPAKCHVILEKMIGKCFDFAKAQIDVGVDTMKISSPFVGSSFISKEHYTEFVLPYEKEITRRIHEYKPGIPVYTHTCGFIGDRLELMAATGIDGIECMDPPPLGDTQLADAKNRIGRDLFLKGNMDSVNILLRATAETMDGYVKNLIRDGGKDGGYILSSACSVAPGVDPAILKTLVPLAEKYGAY